MKFLLLVYNDESLLNALPANETDGMMRTCLTHADELKDKGTLLDFQQLEAPSTAKSVRIRNNRRMVVDGPFTEAKEYLGGFNLIEADSLEEAIELAAQFPWARTGCIEVRPVRDISLVRKNLGV
ncbi:YciI family protein [Pendulispora albinea]|uniref:YciI family protein n=1 Tax=Pendulispora albinea TaxID=2741071 RepID=A0ABZ2M3D4_9BACT